jgi:hypothetical protein
MVLSRKEALLKREGGLQVLPTGTYCDPYRTGTGAKIRQIDDDNVRTS